MKISDRKVNLNTDGIISAGISSPEEMLLFDIETTGLKKEYCRVYLIGCAYIESDGWHIRQWLTQEVADEINVLKAFGNFACGFKLLVTFNGERFDIPFVDFRNRYYGLDSKISGFESLDIYKEIKPAKKLLGAKSFSQKSVEGIMGIRRDDKLDGGLLIPYYYEYEVTKSPENEKLLLLHNFEDVLGMGKILPVLNYPEILKGNFSYSGHVCTADKLTADFLLDRAVPAAFRNDKIYAEKNILSIDFDIKDGMVLFPLNDVENYYYLPFEDRIIHKDLAAFVEKKYKRKAARENCFLKVETERIKELRAEDFRKYAVNAVLSC